VLLMPMFTHTSLFEGPLTAVQNIVRQIVTMSANY